jgi:hypothetical protein
MLKVGNAWLDVEAALDSAISRLLSDDIQSTEKGERIAGSEGLVSGAARRRKLIVIYLGSRRYALIFDNRSKTEKEVERRSIKLTGRFGISQVRTFCTALPEWPRLAGR